MKKLLLLTIVGCVAFLFQSCQKSDDYPTAPDAQSAAAVVPADRTIQVTVTGAGVNRIVAVADQYGYMDMDDIPQSAILGSATNLYGGSFTVHVPSHLTGNFLEFYIETSSPVDGMHGTGFDGFGALRSMGTFLTGGGFLTSANNYTITLN